MIHITKELLVEEIGKLPEEDPTLQDIWKLLKNRKDGWTRKTWEEIREILLKEKPYLQEKYKVKEIGIFGSYVRREQNENSDVDILVDFSETIGLFEFAGLEQYLTQKIDIPVDLVTKSGLKPRIGKNILAEVIMI
jgi:predicted nucleotidyltransferase